MGKFSVNMFPFFDWHFLLVQCSCTSLESLHFGQGLFVAFSVTAAHHSAFSLFSGSLCLTTNHPPTSQAPSPACMPPPLCLATFTLHLPSHLHLFCFLMTRNSSCQRAAIRLKWNERPGWQQRKLKGGGWLRSLMALFVEHSPDCVDRPG